MGNKLLPMLRLTARRSLQVFERRLCSAIAPTGTIQNEHGISYPTPQVGTPCNVFRSDAEARIAQVPIIMVDGDMAYCDGGGGPRGHPVENIQLNLKRPGEPSVCKYCGLRFMSKPH